jgi:threonine dehydrogenase-like Zn-dependent dehydrogenase
MRMLTLQQPGELTAVEVPTPQARSGQVRVAVEYVGLCGSDIEVFTGRRPARGRYGHPVLGHQMCGVVDQVGPGAAGLRVGDRVTAIEAWGALAEWVVTTPVNALAFDDRIDPADGCLLEVLPGVAMAAWRTGIRRGDDVLIVGQGLSGLLITQLVAVQGCRRLVVVEPDPVRAGLARDFGAHEAYTAAIAGAAAAIAADHPSGFDIAIVATPDLVVDEIAPLMRPRSRIVLYGGLQDTTRVNVMALHRRSISLLKEGEGINGVREARALWREALQLAYDGVLRLAPLRTHEFMMGDAERALRLRAEGQGIHVVLRADGMSVQ